MDERTTLALLQEFSTEVQKEVHTQLTASCDYLKLKEKEPGLAADQLNREVLCEIQRRCLHRALDNMSLNHLDLRVRVGEARPGEGISPAWSQLPCWQMGRHSRVWSQALPAPGASPSCLPFFYCPCVSWLASWPTYAYRPLQAPRPSPLQIFATPDLRLATASGIGPSIASEHHSHSHPRAPPHPFESLPCQAGAVRDGMQPMVWDGEGGGATCRSLIFHAL